MFGTWQGYNLNFAISIGYKKTGLGHKKAICYCLQTSEEILTFDGYRD